MKEFAPQLVKVSTGDRLVTTLFFAVLLHGIVILGIGFSGEEPSQQSGSTLEITLVNTRNSELPDDADYLADASQRGSGNTREHVRPQAAMSSPDLAALDGAADATDAENRLAEQAGADHPTASENAELDAEERRVVTEGESERKTSNDAAALQSSNDRVLVARLMTPGNELTEPVNDANQQPQARSDKLREKVISVNTRESLYARYLDAWRRQVERVGNANYPDAARREGMEGSLTLEVSLNSDGTIRNLVVRRKSPWPLLDQAAVRTVRLAAPFPPFSKEMQAETDVLRFAWVWQFGRDGTRSSVRGHVE